MKLATLKTASPDGQLLLVSSDLTTAVKAKAAATLQEALEGWDAVASALEAEASALEAGAAPDAFDFDPAAVTSPLPRAYQWLDASSFLAHGRLLDKAFNIPPIPQADVVPIMYQGASDAFLGPRDDAPFVDIADGVDFEAEFAIVTGEVPIGATEDEAKAAVRLVLLVNDWSLRNLQRFEMMRGFGPIHAKPATAFAPVAVTPDVLGAAWTNGHVELPVQVSWNGTLFGQPSGAAMDYRYWQLIQHAARTRALKAGTIIGFGTVSEGAPEKVGSACIAERRGYEIIEFGAPQTAFMAFGDSVRIEVFDGAGVSVFGAIEQTVVQARA
jgi:fumarylacetoacetate (FAA) hydrolase